MAEGITEVKDLLLFKSPINNIHLRDLDILKDKCDLNTLQFVKLKRNIEALDTIISTKPMTPQKQISEQPKQTKRFIPAEAKQFKDIASNVISNNELCDYKYAFTPVMLRTFYPDHDVIHMHDDELMVKSELVSVLHKDALNHFESVRVEIETGFNEKYNITFDEYTFDNSLNDDRLITFGGKILNSSAYAMQTDFTTSELMRIIGCDEIEKIFKKCKYITNITITFKTENETVDCIDTVFNYTLDIVPQFKEFIAIDFVFVGFVMVDIALDYGNKNEACTQEFGKHSHGMKYNEMIAANKDKEFMELLPNLNDLEYPICGNQVEIDKKEYRNEMINNKWPKDLSDFDEKLNNGICYIPCVQDYKRSYLFAPTYYVI